MPVYSLIILAAAAIAVGIAIGIALNNKPE